MLTILLPELESFMVMPKKEYWQTSISSEDLYFSEHSYWIRPVESLKQGSSLKKRSVLSQGDLAMSRSKTLSV